MTSGDEKKPGCVRQAFNCGCTGLGLFMVAGILALVFAGHEARQRRKAIQVGMTAEQAFAAAAPWLMVAASNVPRDEGVHFTGTALVLPGEPPPPQPLTPAEVGRRLAERMGPPGGGPPGEAEAWTATFGYLTVVPRRAYFTVGFGADDRVVHVGNLVWGRD